MKVPLVLDIEDRQETLNFLSQQIALLEIGIRSVCIMYDEHSSDKDSYENIFRLKDNIYYRLISAKHQFSLLLKEHDQAEDLLFDLSKDKPIDNFLFKNPYFEAIEIRASSIFDCIIYHISSIFDYLSHIVCYICTKNKQKTVYWTKLANSARGENNEICALQIHKTIDNIDRGFVCELYNYRSRLIHNKRDIHKFTAFKTLSDGLFNIKINSSIEALGHFKQIKLDKPNYDNYTICAVSFWLLQNAIKNLDEILSALTFEIKKDSFFHNNILSTKKVKPIMVISYDSKTNTGIPASENMWNDYRIKYESNQNNLTNIFP